MKKILITIICLLMCSKSSMATNIRNPFSKTFDTRSKELRYQYNVLKDDEKKQMEGKLLNRTPSGYMTVQEYENLSEYKDKSNYEFEVPKIERPSDFKYVPQPLFKIVKYNNPPGNAELSLGKKLFVQKMINAQGIVSPDYSKLVYPAVYYYPDSASVACDLFVVPLFGDENVLSTILKANVANRNPIPILSTDKSIDNFAAFRTLTPVDFSSDGTKLLVKEKLGSSEDGIWETKLYVYDFSNKVSYDLIEIRDAISYFWKEYMSVNLIDKRWDIIPLGFDLNNPDRVVVQAYAYTGSTPVYLGAWSVDYKGEQSRLISFNKSVTPNVSENGYKVIRDGVESYQTVETQEKFLKQQGKVLEKQKKAEDKEVVKDIKNEYKYNIKVLNSDYKDEYRDYKKLQTLKGSTEGPELEEAYKKYLKDQLAKDIVKTEKQIKQKQKEIDSVDKKLDKLYDKTGESSKSTIENPEDSVQNQ